MTWRLSGHPHVRGDYAPGPDRRVGPAGHPHVRGDYIRIMAAILVADGPSPRAWGLRSLLLGLPPPSRAIPTCVGTTGLQGEELPGLRAIPTCVGTTEFTGQAEGTEAGHPHVRGDYGWPRGPTPGAGGPSPRAWGLRDRSRSRSETRRAIPTCVGTTRKSATRTSTVTGHPHVRGDYQAPAQDDLETIGPSPRAWGLRAWAR